MTEVEVTNASVAVKGVDEVPGALVADPAMTNI